MKIVSTPIALAELDAMAEAGFGVLVKAVVDVDRRLMAVDAELHADEEALLLADGSRQEHLWGINLYPGLPVEEWVEFDAMINVRPSRGNPTRGVEDPVTRERILAVVSALVAR
jgi:hypothetical protein